MYRVTVVPADQVVIVDDEVLFFEYAKPDNIHAIQWTGDENGFGEVEFEDEKPNEKIDASRFPELVQPFVDLFYKEKNRVEELRKKEIEFYNSEPERLKRLRLARDSRLVNYDSVIQQLNRGLRLCGDNDAAQELKDRISVWDAYAEALCNLPEQSGAPWDGGGPLTPWPEMPAI